VRFKVSDVEPLILQARSNQAAMRVCHYQERRTTVPQPGTYKETHRFGKLGFIGVGVYEMPVGIRIGQYSFAGRVHATIFRH
jgi:hypothetical protein